MTFEATIAQEGSSATAFYVNFEYNNGVSNVVTISFRPDPNTTPLPGGGTNNDLLNEAVQAFVDVLQADARFNFINGSKSFAANRIITTTIP